MRARGQGFTLVELVVAIAISGMVVAFAALFIAAPINAFETESRRSAMVDEGAAGWPAIEADLQRALPNSLRAHRNGSFVILELLRVDDSARYMAPPSGSFTVAGVFRGVPVPFNQTDHYLSMNNCGPGPPACPDAYTLAGSMTPLATQIRIDAAAAGEQLVRVAPAPAFASLSPHRAVYLVSGPVTYLCDETQGTLRRYENYPVAASPATFQTPNAFAVAGFSGELEATGLTSCDFRVAPKSATVPQTASLALGITRSTGESVTLFYSAGSGWLP